MNSLDEFKKTKRDFKQKINKLDEVLESQDEAHDFKKLSQVVMQAREMKMDAEKL